MRFSLLCWFTLLVAVVFGDDAGETVEDAVEDKPPAEVVVLEQSNFEHLTQVATGATTGDWFVEFYAPWCGHCKRLEPAWKELAQELSGEINVAKVDVTANGALGKRFGIKGFPTLVLFHQGTMYKYQGPRETRALAHFARQGYKGVAGTPVPADAQLLKTLQGYLDGFITDAAAIPKGKMPRSSSMIMFAGGLLLLMGIVSIVGLVTSGPAAPAAAAKPKTS